MKGVSPPAATEAGVPDLVSKKVNPPPGTGAVQGTRAVKREVGPPPAAVPRKRKATDELGMDRTGVIFSNPLTSTCLCKVQKEMHDLLMLAMYLC